MRNNQSLIDLIGWGLIASIIAGLILLFTSCTVNKYVIIVQPIKERTIEVRTEYPTWNDWGISPTPGLTITPWIAPNPFTLEPEFGDDGFYIIDTSLIVDDFILFEYDSIRHRPISQNLIPR